ncbi:hypothetical protein RND81_08G007200 [Saponaria officinalis]|uniref:Uncharacterized protein n=1 Tax=Saponaria officinalis TaxID=3572 RepID=A0AAW1J3Y5_SAPOF
MRGALFGDQVEGYKEAFVYNGVYEIANAPIKHCSEQWKSNSNELNYQMTFGRQTIIQAVNTESGPILPEYQCISQIPKAGNPDDKFDVLGIVLYVEEKARKINISKERENLVREIVITDHRPPMIISTWNDLAENDCDALSSSAKIFSVVGFTALRVSTHKGFSLTSSMSTTIIHDPKGSRARALEDWVSQHQEALSDRQTRILDVHNTLQEERRWLKVVIPDANFDKVNAYLGCSNCGKRTDVPVGKPYACTTCSKDFSDGTGTLAITMFTQDCEKMFRMTAPDIFRVKNSDDRTTFKAVQQLLRTPDVLIEVGPKTTLSRNNVLQWVLKQVVIEPKEAQVKDKDAHIENEDNVEVSTSQVSVPTIGDQTNADASTPTTIIGVTNDAKTP